MRVMEYTARAICNAAPNKEVQLYTSTMLDIGTESQMLMHAEVKGQTKTFRK